MEEQDYLKKGKQMENLYKDRISKLTLEVNHQLDTVDILCSQKIKSDYSDFSLSDNCFVNIDDIASKVERYIFRPLLLELEQAESPLVRNKMIHQICEIFHEDVKKELMLEDSRDTQILPEEEKANFSQSEWFCDKGYSKGVLLKISYKDTNAFGYTAKHKASRRKFCRIYFKSKKNKKFPVIDIGYFLGMLYELDMIAEYLNSRKGNSKRSDYVQLLAKKLCKDLDKVIKEYCENRSVMYKRYFANAESMANQCYEEAKMVSEKVKEFMKLAFDKNELPDLLFERTLQPSNTDFRNPETYFSDPINMKFFKTEFKNPEAHFADILISAMVHQYQNVYYDRQYKKSIYSDYARSFETKKNIPQNILTYMMNCSFNKFFGFVEIDEDCDTKKIDMLWKEFAQFKDKYFPNELCQEYSIRFRKLGNHHASGLYYPDYKCMCVDLADSGSFVHEFGHLIDDKYDGLSLKKEFEEVLFHYQKLLRSLPKGTFPENGVYTLRYYLTPTEVFARSLEIYFTHFEKLNTDIIAQPDAPCYPQNKELYELIKKYWDKWLIKIGRECK